MNIFRTLEEENLVKKDLELQKKARKLNDLSKFIEEKIIEFNLNIGKTNLKEVTKHAKLIEIKYNYLTTLIRSIEESMVSSKNTEETLVKKVNEKIKHIENLQKELDSSVIKRTKTLRIKENNLIQREKDLIQRENLLLEKQKLLFN
tara:strand:+ start:2789 stop:3229 length:441 start_codon:yes stop_codon:yes gene_type:complete